ncbi:MAG TPA: hypothetical protein PLV06_04450 [Bacteroidales bacterium]|nr:hypothetical protein [Bacteroidales bacterium]HPJ58438.1 hypothetical protein [Bacteroidales bacterium]HPR11613.1 hypothetical protein [Bacteroidales bacterium]
MSGRSISFISLAFLFIQSVLCQPSGPASYRVTTRYNFYSFEKDGEVLLFVPPGHRYRNINVSLSVNNINTGSWKGTPGGKIVRVPITIDQDPGYYNIIASVSTGDGNKTITAESALTILRYKPNEVKTDRLTGGLIVNRRPFFPFGFYTYSPVHPALAEEEVVKGFNMISPYQKILPGKREERKAYMDRCAQLGMKVHYNLLSVAGGGGVGSVIEGMSPGQRIEFLREEVIAFRDHPALLAWYIADEPNGYKISPDSLMPYYNIIKELDPWHPVSMVFMTPFISALDYAGVLDIVMADPYPVPSMPVSMVGNVAGQLYTEYRGKKPVWIAVQAFGGGEIWEREPTAQELRAMTYQSIIRGARGIQYFVRQGLNLFPKSTSAWAECGKMAVEIAELTPWLLSDEAAISVKTSSPNIMAASALHDGRLMIIASNRSNAPARCDLSLGTSFTGKARVLFENRSLPVNGGYFSDILSPYGSQVYMLTMKQRKDDIRPWTLNLIRDPGFEDLSSPGIPSATYARNGGDRGATFFTDTREFIEGYHSVRLVTPTENGSAKLRLFPYKGKAGRSYYISIWAKCDPEQGLDKDKELRRNYFEIALNDYGHKQFELTDEWREYVTIVTIPPHAEDPSRTNLILQMPTAGVAWFDMVQVMESVDINRSINPQLSLTDQW